MKKTILSGILVLLAARLWAGDSAVSLAGQWRFELDRADAGIAESWFKRALPGRVKLPGDLSEQGIGDLPSLKTKWTGGIQKPNWYLDPELERYSRPDNFKFPYWLTPQHHYVGAAWFQREFEVPQAWADRRVVLTLERPHWETRVWVDGRIAGTNTALATPHVYDLGSLKPGKHLLTIRVDNRMIIDVGENSHSVSDHTQGNWNGIVGKIELRATSPVWIEEIKVTPQVARRAARVEGTLGNMTGRSGRGTVTITAELKGERGSSRPQDFAVSWDEKGGTFAGEIAVGPEAELWDEFSPAVYELNAVLESGAGNRHAFQTVFGLREIGVQGTQFTINGRKTFFRGTLECAIFPKTGHPPTDTDSWKRILKAAQAHGLNMLRFHSWCPPEAAFNAADELGVYLQVECSSWANQSTTLGDGKPVDAWIYQEADRILKHYGNHPSFVLLLYGNEPGGPKHKEYLETWVEAYKRKDPRRLYSSGAGWPQIAPNQFHLTPDPRVQQWGHGLKSRINGQPPETTTDYRDYINHRTVPVISHEIGQWCVFPNFDEIRKYTGYLKARNFEIFRESLNANHMGHQAKQFLLASGKLQALCYKEDIESALRTPGMGGFQLLDLHDFPGQGTALVGVLDPFWEEKGYISPEAYRRFCNSTVPLARMSKRVFTTAETFQADIEMAHFGPAPLRAAATTWKLVGAEGKTIAEGRLPQMDIPVDNGIKVGAITAGLGKVKGPEQCSLVLVVTAKDGKTGAGARFENDWDIWVYPAAIETESANDVSVVQDLDDETVTKLNKGGKVLLLIPPARVRNVVTNKVVLGFSSIFWNTAWTQRQPPTTLGILCDPKHPALAEFPTDYHSNWQWWYLIHRANALILDGLPAKLQPTVQVIDDWVTNHRLGLLFEARVGKGKLMVSSIDLANDLEADPVRRQFRYSVLQYMSGKRFAPKVEVSLEQIQGLMKPVQKGSGVESVEADSEELGYEAANAVDLDPTTIWHTAWTPERKPYPHELRIAFSAARAFTGFTVLPRQDGNRNGWIREYACYVSQDGKTWMEPISRGAFNADSKLKTVTFQQPVTARFVRFVALSGFGSDAYSSLAEFSMLDKDSSAQMRDERGIPVRQVRGVRFERDDKGVVQVPVNGRSPGLVFDGVGAVSAGGSTRLLVDYPEPERSQILDYLFKPNYGAALQILKVEIGADTDSTSGAEASHERDRGEVRADRGYEWWLMKEARARNPNIKLAALAWGAPGWMTNFWSDDNIRYTLAWLDCAKKNGLKIDYLGGGNERGWDANYYIKLAAALEKHGYGSIQVVASDDHNPPNYWAVASEIKKNPVFADAVDIIGQHDVCGWRTLQKHCSVSTAALELGKPLWDSENSTQDYRVGPEPLARVMSRHYLEGGITANLNWAPVAAWYGTFPAAGTGLMLADRPWSGYYDVGKSVWIDAHLTQFTQPGWRHLDSACGYTPAGASLITLRSPSSQDYTLYIETMDLANAETLGFDVSGGLDTGPVHVWATAIGQTHSRAGSGQGPGPLASALAPAAEFEKITTLEPREGRYHFTLDPGFVYTLSTTAGQKKGQARPRADMTQRLPMPFEENFDGRSPGQLARYFSDVHGAFEVVRSAGGRPGNSYRQMVKREPILWHRAKMPPTTIVGDPHWWGDYEISADVLLEDAGYVEVIGRIESQQHTVAGYHLQIDHAGRWRLYTQNANGTDRVLASGTNQPVGLNQWHRLALRFLGEEITARLDNQPLVMVRDDSHSMGQVGFRVSPWQHAQFDNVRVVATGPSPQLVPRHELTISGTSEHAQHDHGMTHAARNAIDDRLETTWRSEYDPAAPLPQSITLDLGKLRHIGGLICRPSTARVDDAGGRFITEYNVALSLDGREFEKVASGKWNTGEAARSVPWPPRQARYVRLEATASSSPRGVEVSEISVLEAPSSPTTAGE